MPRLLSDKCSMGSVLECWDLQDSNVSVLKVIFCYKSTDILSGTPSYVSRIKPGKFPLVLRNLHLSAIVLNATMMLLVLSLVPLDTILGGSNVLSVLAQVVTRFFLSSPVFKTHAHCSPVDVGYAYG